jgi:hypothetical protein
MPNIYGNPDQMQFRLTDDEPESCKMDDNADYWPTPEQIEARRRQISEELAKPLISTTEKEKTPVAHEEAEAIDGRRIEQLKSKAVKIFPDLFACKSDVKRFESEIDGLHRDNTGRMTYPRAFEAVMGYSIDIYNQLGDKPKHTFEDKGLAYIEIAEKIFANPNPDKKMKKQLKDMIKELTKLRISILGPATRGGEDQLPQDDAIELIKFASLRIEELERLKK